MSQEEVYGGIISGVLALDPDLCPDSMAVHPELHRAPSASSRLFLVDEDGVLPRGDGLCHRPCPVDKSHDIRRRPAGVIDHEPVAINQCHPAEHRGIIGAEDLGLVVGIRAEVPVAAYGLIRGEAAHGAPVVAALVGTLAEPHLPVVKVLFNYLHLRKDGRLCWWSAYSSSHSRPPHWSVIQPVPARSALPF